MIKKKIKKEKNKKKIVTLNKVTKGKLYIKIKNNNIFITLTTKNNKCLYSISSGILKIKKKYLKIVPQTFYQLLILIIDKIKLFKIIKLQLIILNIDNIYINILLEFFSINNINIELKKSVVKYQSIHGFIKNKRNPHKKRPKGV